MAELRPKLTPKSRLLADFVAQNPRRAVFMRIRDLAREVGVSVSSVVRFVNQLGFTGYGEFLQALRDQLDTGLTLMDRVELRGLGSAGEGGIKHVILEDIRELQRLYEGLDQQELKEVAEAIWQAPWVYVMGARLSYSYAHNLGWCLSRLRPGIQILAGSDQAALDWLTLAPEDSLVVMVATSRYPNVMLRAARMLRSQNRPIVALVDSRLCPLIQFAEKSLVAPSRSIPVMSCSATMASLINCLVMTIIENHGDQIRQHQEKVENFYRENDIFFNLERL